MKVYKIIAKLKSEHHANLDSFPFRYGFFSQSDIEISLTDTKRISDEYIHDPHKRYGVTASFKFPNQTNTLRGKFILMKSNNTIATIIREGSSFKAEHLLSETLKTLREDGDIDSYDLIDMYKDRIRTHAEVVKHLSNKIGKEKVLQAERTAEDRIERLSKLLQKSRKEVEEQVDHIDNLNETLVATQHEKDLALEREAKTARKNVELAKKLKRSDELNTNIEKNYIELKLSKELDVNTRTNYSKIDWSKETSTSGVFKSYRISGDYLVVVLYDKPPVDPSSPGAFLFSGSVAQAALAKGLTREIKCKNTHVGDYQKAVKYIESLVGGDMVVYSTRGAGAFGSQWFYKIEKDNKTEETKQSTSSGQYNDSHEPSINNTSRFNSDDSDWGDYGHDTNFDIDENGNIQK
jgi:hypothetical protein